MPRNDLEEQLRRTLHAWLDTAEPPRGRAVVRRPRLRAAPAGAFGLVGLAVVLGALLLVPRFAPGPAAGTSPASEPGGSGGIFAAGVDASPGGSTADAALTGPSIDSSVLPGPAGSTEPVSDASGAPSVRIAVPPESTPAPPTTSAPREQPPGTAVPVQATPAQTEVPVATPAPTTGSSAAPAITVTMADNGSIVTLSVGQTLTLQLGGAYEWKVTIANPSVLVPAPGTTAAQPALIAASPGLTRLVAAGDPPCRHAKPACEIPSIALEITVVVR